MSEAYSTTVLTAEPSNDRRHHHYHVLDLARGLAAFAILIWHYQHFYIVTAGAELSEALRSQQPLFDVLKPIYLRGYLAVQFFWLLSGFVFAAVYVGRAITTRSFVVNRFARLYPLHLLTLLVVAALQITSVAWLGHWQIYENNDLVHLIAQLFMASNWLSTTTFSFNGPFWSVSVEVLFYALFWVTRPVLFRAGIVGPAILAALFAVAMRLGPVVASTTMACGFYFFTGAACNVLTRHRLASPLLLTAGAASLFVGGLLIMRAAATIPLTLTAAVLVIVALEPRCGSLVARRLHWIGDSTYGLYLWHVPIQIAALLILDGVIGTRAVVGSPVFLVGFLIVMGAVAIVSFRRVEAPWRLRLRRWDGAATSRQVEPGPGISAP